MRYVYRLESPDCGESTVSHFISVIIFIGIVIAGLPHFRVIIPRQLKHIRRMETYAQPMTLSQFQGFRVSAIKRDKSGGNHSPPVANH